MPSCNFEKDRVNRVIKLLLQVIRERVWCIPSSHQFVFGQDLYERHFDLKQGKAHSNAVSWPHSESIECVW